MKLLAVDDQEAVLTMLKNRLDCKKLGIAQFDTACGAARARELLAVSAYEIILCDIEMPEEDGISFARWVLERYPDTKLIFLTSHMDASYMKEAISMHSFDYVFQPFVLYELETVLRKAAVQYRVEAENRSYQEKGMLFQSYGEEIFDARIMRYLEGESEDTEELRQLADQQDIRPGSGPWAPFLVQFHEQKEKMRAFGSGLVKFSLKNILEELLEPLQIRCNLVRGSESFYYGIFYAGAVAEEEFSRKRLAPLLQSLREIGQSIFGVSSTLYLYPCIWPSGLRLAYGRLKEAVEENVDRREMYFVSERENRPVGVQGRAILVPEESWKRLLVRGEFRQLEESIFRYIAQVSGQEGFGVKVMTDIHKSFNVMLLSYMAERELDSTRVFTPELPYQKYMLSYQSCEAFESMVHYVMEQLQQMTGGCQDAVDEAMKYIRLHLSEPVTVSEISDAVGMNAEYLTKQFRKRTGQSLKSYVTAQKIEMAKMLLRTTDLSVTMISDHTGYDNYNNFTRVFKRCTDMTPAEYRRDWRTAEGAQADQGADGPPEA